MLIAVAVCQTIIREQRVLLQVYILAKRKPGSSEESRQKQRVPTERRIPGGVPARVSEGLRRSTSTSRTHPGAGSAPASSRAHCSVWTQVCSGNSTRTRPAPPPAATGTGADKGALAPCLHAAATPQGAPSAHLNVAVVGPSVAIHALHRGRLSLHQVDSEQGLESHWVVHMRVMGRQVHPANDEQAIHLQGGERAQVHTRLRMRGRGRRSPTYPVRKSHPRPHTAAPLTLGAREHRGAPSSAPQRARPIYQVLVN